MSQNWNQLALVGLISGALSAGAIQLLNHSEKDVVFKEAPAVSLNKLTSAGNPSGVPGDFTYAADVSMPAVVHITSTMKVSRGNSQQMQIPEEFREFFGDRVPQSPQGPQKQQASGSGVIISPDGYIVTNNHVVEGAEELEVVLSDKHTYKAKVIGTDPSTDLAVIQIPANNLPALTFGNSDAARVGEWVVAVGNPFNLESTVTTGIVSAKGRGLGIIGQKQRGNFDGPAPKIDSPLESFIQTDAVVNPGNSGGALVNLKGELIGINTAIASPTGSFAGYAFAVPSNLVKKVAGDLVKYGNVQRGYLGIMLDELDSKKAEEYGVKETYGVYVKSFSPNSAAKEAGIKEGDVILKVDGVSVNAVPQLQEQIGRKQPGESVTLTLSRGGTTKDVMVKLKNRDGGSQLLKLDSAEMLLGDLGVQLNDLSPREKALLKQSGVEGGAKVGALEPGKFSRAGVQEGFIITKLNDKPIHSVQEFKKAIEGKKGARVQIEGIYSDAPADNFTFGFNV
ncbi:Do family serine endopeptidase [Runella sp.]|uniref:Do family serine endopeptidase n=1 Tax=Runella sp. TaxID=1960881 RepID=UPI003D0DCA59